MTSDTSEPREQDDGARRPAPFVLSINTPPGMPWDQWRLARLEAENSAPLPVGQLRYDLRRSRRWRPGQPGLFAAAFFHRDQVDGEASHVQEVDGLTVQFTVRDEASANRERLRKWAPPASAALGVAALLGSLLLAIGDRDEADAAIEAQRQQAQRALTARENAQRRAAEARALDLAGARGAQLSDALEDIGWLSRAKDPAASVTAVEWTPDGLVLTAVGPSNPIVAKDRTVEPASVPGPTSQWIVRPPADRRPNPTLGPAP